MYLANYLGFMYVLLQLYLEYWYNTRGQYGININMKAQNAKRTRY